MNGPFETELKFQVPLPCLAALKRSIATPSARTLTLQARYFDTPDQHLAHRGVALRMRREGTQWVQTVKAPGPSAVARLEHEVRLEHQVDEPSLDPARHTGTAAGDALDAALGHEAAALQLVFETTVQRTLRTVRLAGTSVELALDIGELRAGGRQQGLCEIEFELKRGSIEGLLDVAGRWARRHRLWLDVRSKAERGLQLALGAAAPGPVPNDGPALTPDMDANRALRTVVGACLAQVLPAAAAVAGDSADIEPLHQLRVGLRRLRCAFRLFGDVSGAAEPIWSSALATLFDRLGSTRNRDVFAATVFPALRAAGAPLAELPPDPAEGDPGAAVRDVACTELLLKLLAFAHGAAPAQARQALSLWQPPLRRLRRQLQADADQFSTLDDEARHRCRKRLKRWRYGLEFVAPLYPAKAVKRNLARVRKAQELLGRCNDLATAEQAFSALAAQDPRAWFAVGWLRAERERLVPGARKALVKVAAAARDLRPLKARAPRRPDERER